MESLRPTDLAPTMDIIRELYNIDISLKPVQHQVLINILWKKNTLAVLPTGYGKSMLYLLPPLLLDIVSINFEYFKFHFN